MQRELIALPAEEGSQTLHSHDVHNLPFGILGEWLVKSTQETLPVHCKRPIVLTFYKLCSMQNPKCHVTAWRPSNYGLVTRLARSQIGSLPQNSLTLP